MCALLEQEYLNHVGREVRQLQGLIEEAGVGGFRRCFTVEDILRSCHHPEQVFALSMTRRLRFVSAAEWCGASLAARSGRINSLSLFEISSVSTKRSFSLTERTAWRSVSGIGCKFSASGGSECLTTASKRNDVT